VWGLRLGCLAAVLSNRATCWAGTKPHQGQGDDQLPQEVQADEGSWSTMLYFSFFMSFNSHDSSPRALLVSAERELIGMDGYFFTDWNHGIQKKIVSQGMFPLSTTICEQAVRLHVAMFAKSQSQPCNKLWSTFSGNAFILKILYCKCNHMGPHTGYELNSSVVSNSGVPNNSSETKNVL
jgi:hypothetical protein